MPYPDQFGQPCWEKDQADKCINTVAQVAREKAPLFLATHSPIRNIKDSKADSFISEEEAFQNLFSRKGEIRGVVRGDSGTGKSHLIRWINLRAEYAATHKELGLDRFKIVMVQRETGSLKAALNQIVAQLGSEFAKYVKAIKSSVDRFSAEAAREELITEMALEINSRWEQRGREALPKRLKRLGDALLSPDYKRWLGRDEGVVARIIARLTESSTPEDRERKIVFDAVEIEAPENAIDPMRTSAEVRGFIGDIRYEEGFPDEVIEVMNEALVAAQRELTGIKGAQLNDIFTQIRRRLHTKGKQLAVFIEDVTAASGGLDLDLFQAFEPTAGQDLCRMIALLGMTNPGWNVLPDNEKDRVNFQFDVGENAAQWSTDKLEVGQFTARYLNALRCDDQQISDLASDRFASDVSLSRCDECPHREICLNTFGYAQLEGDVRIGLFPLSDTAPQRLLKALNEERHRSSPRGLLDYVLDAVLIKSYDQYAKHAFPDARVFAVRHATLMHWTEVVSKYLGGAAWSSGSRQEQARFLAEFWFDADSADEASTLLKPYLKPLGFPDLSGDAPPSSKTCAKCGKPVDKFRSEKSRRAFVSSGICEECRGKEPPPPEDLEEDPELEQLLNALDEWNRGKRLAHDSKFRGFLSDFIGKAMRWQDYRGVPIKFASDRTKGTKPIRIEDQISRVSHLYFLDFHRDGETHHLLEALVRYELEGKKSWVFRNGELHKRRVCRWLRKNQQRIIKSLEPTPPSLVQDAVKSASQVLALATILRSRAPLPKRDPQKRVEEIFRAIWDNEGKPEYLSGLLRRFVEDIEARWEHCKALLVSELGVGQGAAAPKDFIDPLPILDSLEKFDHELLVETPHDKINESFWKTRFRGAAGLDSYAELPEALADERRLIKACLVSLRDFLVECGFEGNDLKRELTACAKELLEVIEIQKLNLEYPNDAFDGLWRANQLQNRRDVWGTNLARAAKIIAQPKDIDTLCFDPSPLKEATNDLAIITKRHLERIENELADQEDPGSGERGGIKEDLLKGLRQISEMLDKD